MSDERSVIEKLNDFEQQLNTLFVESLHLRDVFNYKINMLKQQISDNANKQCIQSDDENSEDDCGDDGDDENSEDADDDDDDEEDADTNTRTNKLVKTPQKTRPQKTYKQKSYTQKDISPSVITLGKAFQMCMKLDKPILQDYWQAPTAFIGVGKDNKRLVKSEYEYTSPIISIFKNENDFIVVTENSIYIVDSKISLKKLS